jgi:hypothetical protein
MTLLSVSLGLQAVAATLAGPAYADTPTPCVSDTNMPRTYTHGSPITGLVSRHGYYYLDVKFGPGCGLGPDGLLHLVGYVHALEILPAVGDLKGGYVPNDSQHAIYWLMFTTTNDTKAYGLPGAGDASKYVSTTDHLDTCFPNSPYSPQICQDGPGTSRLTLRYNGPDVFGLSKGGDVRFRIANESGLIITDFAQFNIVDCSTCDPPILG